jgi:uncharacterized damage-inducible protein DinB
MAKADISTVAPFYRGYVQHVIDFDLFEALTVSNRLTQEYIQSIPEARGEYRYAEGKWTIKEVLCHMMDAERIFAYRALRFARLDKTELPGFDENAFAPEANAHARSLSQLALETQRLRDSTIDLFRSFSDEMLLRTGTANGTSFVAINLGFITAGHQCHHVKVLKERYA